MTLDSPRDIRLRAAGWFADRCSGVCLVFAVAYAAHVLAGASGLPAMALAMILGLALREMLPEPRFEPGYAFVAVDVLRLGIVLLGARLTLGDLATIGWAGILTASTVTLAVFYAGWWLGRHPRIGRETGLVAGGAVAICGASAAAAMAAVLPPSARREQAVIGSIAGVSLVGTALMLLSPWLLSVLGAPAKFAGLFIGASIHDVAQAVGAGYTLGPAAGDAATITKLVRVAWLVPLSLFAGIALRGSREGGGAKARPPLFLVFFLAIVGLSTLDMLPAAIRTSGDILSRGCLLAAVAAMGLRTAPRVLLRHGGPAMLLVVGLSLLAIAVAALGTLAAAHLANSQP